MRTGTLPRLVLLCVLSLLAASSCTKRAKFDLEVYPNAGVSGGSPNIEAVEGTLFLLKQRSSDSADPVLEHFRRTLVQGRGWTERADSEGTVFTDGNMEVSAMWDFNNARPKDPSRDGGLVYIRPTQEGTEVRLWRFVLKPR